jgi:glycosyltransferase involved in cell wall biosynthesis
MLKQKIIRMAVVFNASVKEGGGYVQGFNTLLLLKKIPPKLCEPIYFSSKPENIQYLKQFGIHCHLISISLWDKIKMEFYKHMESFSIKYYYNRLLEKNVITKTFMKHKINLIYFVEPNTWVRYVHNLNYIFTVWDISHLDQPVFPEVRDRFEFERREELYEKTLRKATAVIVDSEWSKKNIIRYYRVTPDRIKILPFSLSLGIQIDEDTYQASYIDIKEKYHICGNYIFYPAQFWAHKNHTYIINAVSLLKEQYNIELYIIFAGGDQGNLEYVLETAKLLGIKHLVKNIGFVANEELPYLYRQSLALVMPTYFGPTNIPPLEAFYLGVPVFYSDLPGLVNQVGDAAILLDLKDPKTLAGGLHKLISNESFRIMKINKGKERLKVLNNDSDRLSTLIKILEEYQNILSCW